jgi:hypothetical protein
LRPLGSSVGPMGIYSEHWEKYKSESVRWLLYLALLLVVGLPFSALVAIGVGRVTGSYPVYLHLVLLAIWLVVFTKAAIRASRVNCPRCKTVYSRGRGVSNCPQCGLGMLQDGA